MKRILISILIVFTFTQTGFSKNGENSRKNSSIKTTSYQSMGFKAYVETGFTAGIGDNSANRFEVLTTPGFQINPYFFIGTGIGCQFYFLDYTYYYDSNDTYTDYFIPLFVDFRANFTKGQVIPFAGFKTGYSFANKEAFMSAGGLYLAPSFGVKYMFNRRRGINANIGYTYQSFQREYYIENSYNIYLTENLGGITFSIGFEF